MLDRIESGGDGRPWRRRGTSLAPELDRKLAGDEPLDEVIGWWISSWRAATGLYIKFVQGKEDIHPGRFSDHPSNFSDNEFAVFMVSVLSDGCGTVNSDNRIADLHALGPSLLELDTAKLGDDAYVGQGMRKYLERLIEARAALRDASQSGQSKQ
jgi:hypothetical protein